MILANMHLVTGYAGQAHVTAADQGSLYTAIFGSGEYVLDVGNKLAATAITNNQIRISDGDLLIQGRQVRLNEGTYVDLTIENGEQGMMRNDLIVARYTKDSVTDVEECNLMVIKGTAAASDPTDPAYTVGDIINNHDLVADMPLYRVPLNGINVQTPVQLFELGTAGGELEDGSVTGAKIANGAVDNNKLAADIKILNATALPASGTALAANTIYNVSAAVSVYQFVPPASGWAHGTFTTDTAVSITFGSGRFLRDKPLFTASTTYEFDVMNGIWVFAEVVAS